MQKSKRKIRKGLVFVIIFLSIAAFIVVGKKNNLDKYLISKCGLLIDKIAGIKEPDDIKLPDDDKGDKDSDKSADKDTDKDKNDDKDDDSGETGGSDGPIQIYDGSNKDIVEHKDPSKSTYTYGTKVPESTAVDESYFHDAVFIGNSQIEGIRIYKSADTTTVYAGKGINVSTVFTKPVISVGNGQTVTIMNALKYRQFNKVYILFGTNELGWPYDDEFIRLYSQIIDDVKQCQPNAIIYVNSILPVSKEKAESNSIFSNTNIDKFNNLIKSMTKEKQVYYIESKEAVGDSEGYLPTDAGKDGIHLNKKYYDQWFEYLKKHTIK